MAVDRNKLIASAQKYLQRGMVQRALKDYEAIAAAFPDDMRILLKIGDLQARENLFDKAVRTYNEVADYYVAHGFYLKAVAVYKQLLRIRPEDFPAQMRLADLYAQLGLFSDSLAQYNSVAQRMQQGGQGGPYLQVLNRMVELDPTRVGNRIKLAEQYLKLSDVDSAAQQFAHACQTLLEEGRFEEYIKVAERLLHQQPGNVSRIKQLASVYIEVGKPQNAVSILHPLFRQGSYDGESLDLLVRGLSGTGQQERARAILRELVPALESAGRQSELRIAFQLLHELDPADIHARRFLHGDEADLIDFELVEESGTSLSAEQLATVERLLSETDVYLKYNLFDKALAHLEQVLSVHPASVGAFQRRVTIHEAQGNGMALARDLVRLIQYSAAAGTPAAELQKLFGRLQACSTDVDLLNSARSFIASTEESDLELHEVELVPDSTVAADSAAPAGVLDEFDALFGDAPNEELSHAGESALDQDFDFIREIESSFDDQHGLGDDDGAVVLDTDEFLPAALDEQLSQARAMAATGTLADAHALLLELMGEYPEHAEAILRTLDELPVSSSVSSGSQSFADELEQAEESAFGDLFDSDDDEADEAGDTVEDDVEILFDVSEVDSSTASSGYASAPAPGTDFGAQVRSGRTVVLPPTGPIARRAALQRMSHTVELDLDDVLLAGPPRQTFTPPPVADSPAAESGAPEELLDSVEFSAGASGSFDAVAEDVDAAVGRPSSDVVAEFGPSRLAWSSDIDPGFSIAMDLVAHGRYSDAFESLQDQLFGDYPVAASYELSRVRIFLGEFNEASGALEALENAPGLTASDRACIRYLRSICFEALSDLDRARAIWQDLLNHSLTMFPDVPIRLSRASGA